MGSQLPRQHLDKLAGADRPLDILIVEDNPDDAELIGLELKRHDVSFDIAVVDNADAFRGELDRGPWNIILSDHAMQMFDAFDVIDILAERANDTALVIVSGVIKDEEAVSLIRAGAHDFVSKDNLQRLPSAILRAMREVAAQRDKHSAEAALKKANEALEARVEARTAELQLTNDRLAQEIEERRAIAEALEASEARFRAMFDLTPIASLLVSHDDAHIIDVNESFLQLTGSNLDELLEGSVEGLELSPAPPNTGLHQDEPEAQDPPDVLELLVAAKDKPVEALLRPSDAQERTVLIASEEIKGNHDDRSLLVTLVDITRRKETEIQLRQVVTEIVQDTAWFSNTLLEKVARIREDRIERSDTDDLTNRERQVLELIALGHDNSLIAERLELSQQTVRNYISRIYRKIDVSTRAEAIVWARERGFAGLL